MGDRYCIDGKPIKRFSVVYLCSEGYFRSKKELADYKTANLTSANLTSAILGIKQPIGCFTATASCSTGNWLDGGVIRGN